ncbi:hypothetical protein TNCV_40251 [Trichonephila clavipes]|nr:hypothetical protein TNCV_40251 [Trichonephila clavipes]
MYKSSDQDNEVASDQGNEVASDRSNEVASDQVLKKFHFSGGNKWFLICPEYQLEQASPQHNLGCLGLNWDDIHDSPLLVTDFIKVRGFPDLISSSDFV